VKRQARTADWLLFEDALERVLAAVPTMPSETVPLLDAGGSVLAVPAISPLSLPPWDNSGMDGYAVHAADVEHATREAPVRLRVVGEIVAGGFPDRAIGRGEAIHIMTGAPLPEGADTVIRVEHTRRVGDDVEILNAMDTGKNVRPLGEDVRAGEAVLPAGVLLRAG
jgi:molybdopterin molybdotransferase